MPEKRRTRATGFSPGGPQELDINAPTRRSRKTKTQASASKYSPSYYSITEEYSPFEAPKDTPATTARTTRTRSGAKRKNREDVAEEPAAKKSRRQDPTERSEKITPHSQALSSVPDSGSDLRKLNHHFIIDPLLLMFASTRKYIFITGRRACSRTGATY
jgi:hypothetical protein